MSAAILGQQKMLSKRAKVCAALPYEEMGKFMAELRQRGGLAPRALEFTILTAARTNEVIFAKWPEFDLAKKLWRIPGLRRKASRDHREPLSTAVVALLAQLEATSTGQFVFGGDKALSNMAMTKVLERMHRDDITVQGFRATFKDWASNRARYPNEVIDFAPLSVGGDTMGVEKRTKLMEAWAAFCEPR